jgi:hypothetical protein
MGVLVGGMGVWVTVGLGTNSVGAVVGGGKGLMGLVGLLNIESITTAAITAPTSSKTVRIFKSRVFI